MVSELLVIVFWLFTGDPRQYVMATVEELLTRLVDLENEAVQQDNDRPQRNRRW